MKNSVGMVAVATHLFRKRLGLRPCRPVQGRLRLRRAGVKGNREQQARNSELGTRSERRNGNGDGAHARIICADLRNPWPAIASGDGGCG